MPILPLLGALAATAALAPAAHSRPLVLPAPSVQTPIGTQTLHLTDHARSRELMAQLWYPAAKASRRPFADYMEPGVAATFAEVPAGTLRNVRTHARLSAPLAKGRHPVVILATGGIEPRSIYTLYAEELAARGFVVATVDHTDEARAVVFPDGRIAGPAEIPTTLEETVDWVPRAVAVRVADTRFLLDRLEHLRGLDLRRVGMVGHSLGGSTAAEVMLADSRVDAGVNLDGLITPAPIAQGLDRPFMVINVAPTPAPPGWPFSEGYTRGPGSLWENLRGPRYSLTLDGAGHMDFSDLAIWKAQIDAPAFREANDLGPIDSAEALATVRAYVNAFFERHLRDRPAPLLDGPSAAYPAMRFVP